MTKVQIILITLLVYKVVLIAIGVWASKRTNDSDDFFLGGRQLGGAVAALSYSASAASAWVLLGLSGFAYVVGLSSIWAALGSITGMFVTWFWIAPRMMTFSRDHNHLTLSSVLAHETPALAKKKIFWSASFIIVFSFVFYVAAQFQAAGTTFATSFDLSANTSILLGAVIITIYTLLGGFWAVSMTDAIQGLLMALTAVVLPVAAYFAVGGFGSLFTALADSNVAGAFSLTATNVGVYAIGAIVGGLSISFGTYGQPHLMARLMALKDEQALKRARLITIVWYFLVFLGMWFVGLSGHVLYPDLANSEQIFFTMLNGLVPTVIGAIMLAAVLSAIMSTADSQLLAAAAAIASDLGLAQADPKKTLLISRLVVVALVLVSVLVAINLPDKIFSRVLFAWQALGAAFGPILFFRLASKPLPPKAVLASIWLGFLSTVVLSLLPNGPGDIWERLLPFILSASVLFLFRENAAPKPGSNSPSKRDG